MSDTIAASFRITLFVVCISANCLPVLCASSTDSQISFGYKNDNFITKRTFEPVLNVGKDDNITAGFWIDYIFNFNGRTWLFNVHNDVITNKPGNYRTDLLSVFLTTHGIFNVRHASLGVGLITRGNYGGDFIQSTYHRIADITQVKLPYLKDNSTGIIFITAYKYNAINLNQLKTYFYLRNNYRGGPGPGNFRLGLGFDLFAGSLFRKFPMRFQSTSGYLSTYYSDRYISPIFDSGVFHALLGEIRFNDKYSLNCWISLNQYGLKQTHFGATCNIGFQNLRKSDLDDILHP